MLWPDKYTETQAENDREPQKREHKKQNEHKNTTILRVRDIQEQIPSYLRRKDITSLALTSKTVREDVDVDPEWRPRQPYIKKCLMYTEDDEVPEEFKQGCESLFRSIAEFFSRVIVMADKINREIGDNVNFITLVKFDITSFASQSNASQVGQALPGSIFKSTPSGLVFLWYAESKQFQTSTGQRCNNEQVLRAVVEEFWSLWLKPLALQVNAKHLWVPVVEIHRAFTSSATFVGIKDAAMDDAFIEAGNLARGYTLRKKGSSQYYLVHHAIEEDMMRYIEAYDESDW